MKSKRSTATLLILGGGFLMAIDTLLAWQSVTIGGLTFSRNAWHGLSGFLIGILSFVFLANAVIHAGIFETSLKLPHRVLAISIAPAILVLSVIKNLNDSHSGWASYVGILLAALITWGSWMLWQEKPAAEAGSGTPAPAAPEDEALETPAEDA